MINKSNDIIPTTKGFEYLICEMLRGTHIDKMSKGELTDYMYLAGIAIHNIPHNLKNNTPLSISQINKINKLDPTKRNWLLIIQE